MPEIGQPSGRFISEWCSEFRNSKSRPTNDRVYVFTKWIVRGSPQREPARISSTCSIDAAVIGTPHTRY